MNVLNKYIYRILWYILRHTSFEELQLKVVYRYKMREKLNLKNPKTFSEKLQWLKLYNRKPEYTKMVDKYAVKKYVADIIGEEYVIPTLGVWNRPEDIEWDKLPNQFVLKTTHGGGNTGVVICKDKMCFNKQQAIDKLNASLKIDLYKVWREWPYKNVLRRIIAEKYIETTPDKTDLPDYKWYCFNGEPKYCQVIQGRSLKESIDFFDTEWNHQDFVGLNGLKSNVENAKIMPLKPQNLMKQIEIAASLSKNIPFSRIDLYENNNQVLFGEITFYPLSGMGHFRPNDYDLKLGELIQLPC